MKADEYLQLARQVTRRDFVDQKAGLHLVKRARRDSLATAAPTQINYETAVDRLTEDPFADRWHVAPVKKKEGSPYPDRISIGRAPNCDIVLRIPVISKVHAHILRGVDGGFRVRDKQAANSTYLNGRLLEGGTSHPLDLGDEVRFGPIAFEFVDAERLYEILRSST